MKSYPREARRLLASKYSVYNLSTILDGVDSRREKSDSMASAIFKSNGAGTCLLTKMGECVAAFFPALIQLSIYFQWQSKVIALVDPSLSHFYI